MGFNIEQIKELMVAMQQTGLGELDLRDDDYRLTLSAKAEKTVVSSGAIVSEVAVPVATVATETVSTEPAKVVNGTTLRAPIVGTYYSAPSPDKAPFVSVGAQVKKGDVLYIIESMKLMNEIQAEQDGEVVELLVQNGDVVEYDQPILVVK